jgi:ribosomal protein L29
MQEEVGQVVKPRELLKAIQYEISGVKTIIRESQEALKVGKADIERSISQSVSQ